MILPHFALALAFSSITVKIYNEHTNLPVNGVHFVFMDRFPETFDLDVSTAYEGRTPLQLKPDREKRRMDFEINGTEYGLEYWMGCENHFFGKNCDIYCRRKEGSHFTCSSEGDQFCDDGWTGPDCRTKIDPCSSSPCLNGGQCEALTWQEFSCNCAVGYEGMLCDRKSTLSPITTTASSSSTTSMTSSVSNTPSDTNAVVEEEEIIVSIDFETEKEGAGCWDIVLFVAALFVVLTIIVLCIVRKFAIRRHPESALLPTTIVSSKKLSSEKKPLNRTDSPRYVSLAFVKKEINSSPPVLPDSPPDIYLSPTLTV